MHTKPTAAPAAWSFTPIGVFRTRARWPYDAARQGALARDDVGEVHLHPGRDFEQALRDLDGFSHLWLLYVFHHNAGWRPLVRPPRGRDKVGVFASRAPYRPNPIGLSCVELVAVRGRTLLVRGHDLLDGTPVLDIKPYLPYADSVPAARPGWTAAAAAASPPWRVTFTPAAEAQLAWLAERGVECLRGFLCRQLGCEPLDDSRKRVRPAGDGTWEIAYRTWRADFAADAAGGHVCVNGIRSGYSPAALRTSADRYGDKAVHRAFRRRRWPTSTPPPARRGTAGSRGGAPGK